MYKYTVETKREVNTYADLNLGSYVLLDTAKSVYEGSYYTTMASIIFSAFTFEAYLNDIGEELIPYWNEIDRLSINKKCNVICKCCGIEFEKGTRPYQTYYQLFKFRNSLAHGRSKILTSTNCVSSYDEYKDLELKTDEEEFCTIENAEIVREDIKQIIYKIHESSGSNKICFDSGFTASLMTK